MFGGSECSVPGTILNWLHKLLPGINNFSHFFQIKQSRIINKEVGFPEEQMFWPCFASSFLQYPNQCNILLLNFFWQKLATTYLLRSWLFFFFQVCFITQRLNGSACLIIIATLSPSGTNMESYKKNIYFNWKKPPIIWKISDSLSPLGVLPALTSSACLIIIATLSPSGTNMESYKKSQIVWVHWGFCLHSMVGPAWL